jgi:polyhydroxyalkanoate synthesis repressor PhaR
MADKDDTKASPITIKKYANRRLYNTATSSYVTLDHLCQMVKDGQEFVVYDAKTGEDITRAVLTQIIVEEEAKGQNLLPIGFLRQLISFYGDNMQWMVPRYLEHSMSSFSQNQEKMRDMFQNALGGMFPFGSFEEVGKQNLALFESAMRMFSPFPGAGAAPPGPKTEPAEEPKAKAEAPKPDTVRAVEELQKRLDDLQNQLASLSKLRSQG